MCGISGFNWADSEKAASMRRMLAHRGPDAEGLFADDGVSLAHTRLSVIDLSETANQPMQSGRLTIVFNGEVYNYQELKQELANTHQFKTNSDTEVLLAGYAAWGKGVLERLDGMFAFAIWDDQKKELFCARDHAGMKPLYYYWDGERFIFASELKAIFAHDIPRKLNRKAFQFYLRMLYAPAPMTLVENIYALPPEHMLTVREKKLSVERYNSSKPVPAISSYAEATKAVRDGVISAVGRHLVSDVPVGVYLSGGIDSSAVLYSMRQHTRDIKTFSVGFELDAGEEREKFNQDFELAGKTAEFFEAEHHSILVSAKDACDSFERAVAQCDEPVSNPTATAMLLLAEKAKREVSVVLTGSGGDELFGGYERYRLALAADYYMRLPSFIRVLGNLHAKIGKLEYANTADLHARFMFEKDSRLSQVLASGVFEPDSQFKEYMEERYFSGYNGDAAEQLMRGDRESWLPEFFFMLSDKMSMASALEERTPLVDRELVALSRALPRSYKVDLFRTKKVLKDAFKNDLPDYLFDQPKRGWFSPGAKWLRNPDFVEFAREVLSSGYYAGTHSLFDWDGIAEMLEAHIEKRSYNLTLLWAILTFQVWAREYEIEI